MVFHKKTIFDFFSYVRWRCLFREEWHLFFLLQKKTDIVLQACVARVMRLRRCSGRIFCIELFLPKCQSVDYRWRSLLSVVKFENSGSICLTSPVGDSNFEM